MYRHRFDSKASDRAMGKELGLATVAEAQRKCRRVLHRIENLPSSTNITLSSKRTLLKLALSELAFLSSLSVSLSFPDALPFKISSNIGHLEAVVHILEQPFITGVSRVCKPIPLPSMDSINVENRQIRVAVDVVCSVNGKPVWFVVSDRNPKHIYWDDFSGNNRKGLRQRIQQVLAASGSSLALRPSSVVLFFSKGVSHCIQEKLRDEFRALDFEPGFPLLDFDFAEESDGDWIDVVMKSYHGARVLEIKLDCADRSDVKRLQRGSLGFFPDLCFSEMKQPIDFGHNFASILLVLESSLSQGRDLSDEGDLINLDTTALVALVSGISNGAAGYLLSAPESELRHRFKGNYDFVTAQAKSEIQNLIHPQLLGRISGRKGIMCETVHLEFKEIVLMCGGPDEKLRAGQLLKHLIVVPDSPSSRIMSLPTTRKLALKNKILFGTGDLWRAPTLTANMAFVRAVSQTGLSLSTIDHRPRALIGD